MEGKAGKGQLPSTVVARKEWNMKDGDGELIEQCGEYPAREGLLPCDTQREQCAPTRSSATSARSAAFSF